MKYLLYINNLKVCVDDKMILKGVNLEIKKGEICALMGPNGSGKSTLAFTIMGQTIYKILEGKIDFDGQDLRDLSVDKRAKAGIFLAMQNPYEIEGITLKDFLRYAYDSIYKNTEKQLDLKGFKKLLKEKMDLLQMDPEFVKRFVNVGFSGGEKKKAEVLQIAVLQPKFIIFDEIDSGLDIDALKIVCNYIKKIKKELVETTMLIITHYPRILEYLRPDRVCVMHDGKIIKSGGNDLIREIEMHGYE